MSDTGGHDRGRTRGSPSGMPTMGAASVGSPLEATLLSGTVPVPSSAVGSGAACPPGGPAGPGEVRSGVVGSSSVASSSCKGFCP